MLIICTRQDDKSKCALKGYLWWENCHAPPELRCICAPHGWVPDPTHKKSESAACWLLPPLWGRYLPPVKHWKLYLINQKYQCSKKQKIQNMTNDQISLYSLQGSQRRDMKKFITSTWPSVIESLKKPLHDRSSLWLITENKDVFIPHNPFPGRQTWGSQSQHPLLRRGRRACWLCVLPRGMRWLGVQQHLCSGCTPASASLWHLYGEKLTSYKVYKACFWIQTISSVYSLTLIMKRL